MRRPFRSSPALIKRQDDAKTIRRLARNADRQSLAAAENGPHGAALRDLRAFLRRMEIGDGRALVEFVTTSPLRSAEGPVRRLSARLIGDAIVRVRCRSGKAPHDDPLPGQPESAGQAVQRLLREPVDP